MLLLFLKLLNANGIYTNHYILKTKNNSLGYRSCDLENYIHFNGEGLGAA